MSEGTAVSLDALRARIRAIEGGRVQRRRDPSGVPALDDLLGGLPAPGLVELNGPLGSGATRLAAAVLAARARQGQPVAWVDLERTLYPPALADLGVDLRWLLLVRPPAGHEVWAAEQLLRSGSFPVVVISGATRVGRGGQRWAHAVEHGSCTALLVGRTPSRDVPADVRVAVSGGHLTVVRDRAGTFGRQARLASPPLAADPWQLQRAAS